MNDAPLCECGCGEQVRDRRNGIWARWRPGHNRRKKGAGTARRVGPGRPPSLAPLDTEQLQFRLVLLEEQLTLFDPAAYVT